MMRAAIHPISGHAVRSLRTPYFGVTEAAYPPACAVPRHGHATPTVTFVVRGGFDEELPGRSARFGARAFLMKPAAMPHSDRFGQSGARLLLVEIFPELCQASRSASRVAADVRYTESPVVTGLMLRVRRELRRADDCAALCAEGLLLELLSVLARAESPPAGREPHLDRVRERLHDEFGRRLRITDLAAAEQVTPDRLSREFRARFGRSIGEYLRQVRVEWVADALLAGDRPISSLAAEAGFTDQSHMTREFRTAFRLTPAAYRRAARTHRCAS